MTRLERLAEAQTKVDELKPGYDAYLLAVQNLKAIDISFDIGELVSYEETCRQGCCIESAGVGVVESITSNGCYNIYRNDGYHKQYVCHGDMKRLQ